MTTTTEIVLCVWAVAFAVALMLAARPKKRGGYQPKPSDGDGLRKPPTQVGSGVYPKFSSGGIVADNVGTSFMEMQRHIHFPLPGEIIISKKRAQSWRNTTSPLIDVPCMYGQDVAEAIEAAKAKGPSESEADCIERLLVKARDAHPITEIRLTCYTEGARKMLAEYSANVSAAITAMKAAPKREKPVSPRDKGQSAQVTRLHAMGIRTRTDLYFASNKVELWGRDRSVIWRRFEGETVRSIARWHNIAPATVVRIEKRAVDLLLGAKSSTKAMPGDGS